MRRNQQNMDISFFQEEFIQRMVLDDGATLGPWLQGHHQTIQQTHKIIANRRHSLQRKPAKKTAEIKLPLVIPKEVYFTPLITSKDRYLGYRTRRGQPQQEKSKTIVYRSLEQKRRSSLPHELESIKALHKNQRKSSFRIIGLPTTTLIYL